MQRLTNDHQFVSGGEVGATHGTEYQYTGRWQDMNFSEAMDAMSAMWAMPSYQSF